MSEHERRRRTVAAQGFAALALFLAAHGARAATVPASPASPVQAPTAGQARAA